MSKRTVSVILAILAFLCAFAYLRLFLYYLDSYHGVSFIRIFEQGFPKITVSLLVPFSVMLGIALIIWSCWKENPVQIAIWGSAVFFLSLPTAVYYLGYVGGSFAHLTVFQFMHGLGFIKVAVIVSLFTGIASCALALVIFRRQGVAELNLPPPELRQNNSDSVEKALRKLEKLKRGGYITATEYEQRRKECLERL